VEAVQLTNPEKPDFSKATFDASLDSYRDLGASAEFRSVMAGKANFREGSSGVAVGLLKAALTSVGVEVDQTSNTLSAADINSIKDFQQRSGLVADGIVGRSTLGQLNQELSYRDLSPLPGALSANQLGTFEAKARDGAGESIIKSAQLALNEIYQGRRGMPPLEVDGVAGTKTQERISHYQGSRGLGQSGEMDEATLESLRYDLGFAKPTSAAAAVKSEQSLNARTEEAVLAAGLSAAPQQAAVTTPAAAEAGAAQVTNSLDQQLSERAKAVFTSGEKLTREQGQEVISILNTASDIRALDADLNASIGSSMLGNIINKMDGMDRKIALTTYGMRIGMIKPEQGNKILNDISYYRETTGY